MQPTIITFPDTTSLGQAPAPRAPYLTPTQTADQVKKVLAQQQALPPYLRRLG